MTMTERVTGTTPTAVAEADEVLGAKQVVKSVSFLQRFTVLKGAPRELWATFATKFFTIVSYSLMNSTLVLWLASDLGYTDVKAGSVVATWSAIMTLVTILVGSLTDAIGIRRTFLLGIGICLATRAFMVGSVHPVVALGLGLFPVAVGEALLGPVMVAATKRFATTAQRSMAFSMVYAIMNVAFLVSANVFDYVRKGLGEHGHYTVPVLGTLSTYRMLFLLSFVFMLPNFIFVYFFMREGVDVTDDGVTIAAQKIRESPEGKIGVVMDTVVDAGKDTVRIFGGLWRQPGFKRFLVFLIEHDQQLADHCAGADCGGADAAGERVQDGGVWVHLWRDERIHHGGAGACLSAAGGWVAGARDRAQVAGGSGGSESVVYLDRAVLRGGVVWGGILFATVV
jgi:hypothetical protein